MRVVSRADGVGVVRCAQDDSRLVGCCVVNVRVRDFSTVTQRLSALSPKTWRVSLAAEIGGYPFFTVSNARVRRRRPTIFLSGGMHGEEPAGVEAVLRVLESDAARRWPINWFVLPCINPYGWERNQRRNRQNRDINRQFRRRSDVVEAELIKRLVTGQRFLLSLEFHEDVDASGFYFYEGRRHGEYIGERVVQAVSEVVHINRDPIIDGNTVTAEGLIRRTLTATAIRRRPQWPMAYHLYGNLTDNVFGSETPVTPTLDQRARAHVVALETVLQLIVS